VEGNAFKNNALFAILTASDSVDATSNWWGVDGQGARRRWCGCRQRPHRRSDAAGFRLRRCRHSGLAFCSRRRHRLRRQARPPSPGRRSGRSGQWSSAMPRGGRVSSGSLPPGRSLSLVCQRDRASDEAGTVNRTLAVVLFGIGAASTPLAAQTGSPIRFQFFNELGDSVYAARAGGEANVTLAAYDQAGVGVGAFTLRIYFDPARVSYVAGQRSLHVSRLADVPAESAGGGSELCGALGRGMYARRLLQREHPATPVAARARTSERRGALR
jgi:hypothetical protein